MENMLARIKREKLVFQSLGFDESGELIAMLEAHAKTLQDHEQGNGEDSDDQKKMALLVAVNKKMLTSYLKDLRDYRRMGVANTSSIVRFSHDKVVRLTIALAELERNRLSGLPADEYAKKVARMREITQQSLAHSKNLLRDYIHAGVQDTDSRIRTERANILHKMKNLIELDRVLYV